MPPERGSVEPTSQACVGESSGIQTAHAPQTAGPLQLAFVPTGGGAVGKKAAPVRSPDVSGQRAAVAVDVLGADPGFGASPEKLGHVSAAVSLAANSAVVAQDAEPARPSAAPVTTEAYRLHVNLNASDYALLREAQDLLSHRLPQGEVGKVIGMALASLVDQLQRRKHGRLKEAAPSKARAHDPAVPRKDGALVLGENHRGIRPAQHPAQGARVAAEALARTALPRPTVKDQSAGRSRALSRAVKRAVYVRDGGACTYVAEDGHRCGARAFLEYHHVHAFGLGGCNEADNVSLRCRTHNALAAVEDFGVEHQAWAIRRAAHSRSARRELQPSGR